MAKTPTDRTLTISATVVIHKPSSKQRFAYTEYHATVSKEFPADVKLETARKEITKEAAKAVLEVHGEYVNELVDQRDVKQVAPVTAEEASEA